MQLPLKSLGLVLSGGGVRGIAHLGLIKALREHNIEADVVAGSSVGALVGALYAHGDSVEEMLAFFKATPLLKYNFFTFVKAGLMDTEKYLQLFKIHFGEDTFDSLTKKLYVATTNLQKGEQRIFSNRELLHSLLASAALPPVFSPIEIDGELYADGGIMNNFPIEPLQGQCDFIIGSNVSHVRIIKKDEINSSLKLTHRVSSLMIYASNKEKMAQCDLIFEPNAVDTIGILDKKAIEKAFILGYDHAAKKLGKLQRDGSPLWTRLIESGT